MKRFDALDRNTPINRSHLLEASAGTGKTFSIENIVARLIVDPVRPLRIEEILVVTFTRAATQDLKQRIWAAIHSLLQQINHLEEQEMVPDYLLEIIENGVESLLRAKRLWEQALFCFDQAQIFTLHSFCYKMLREFLFEGGLNRDALMVENTLSKKMISKIIQDYFLMEDSEKNRKLNEALNSIHDADKLLDKVVAAILRNVPVEPRSSDDALGMFVRDCQEYFSKIEQKEEASSFNSILIEMNRAVQNPEFAQRVRERYRAAIIDEFQDTDPVQWAIFQTLFLEDSDHSPTLYLVGDPKQSIYSFRQADIYTYLEAARTLGQDQMASLDTNYRSSPALVEALNHLFATPGLIRLPRLDHALDVPKVKSGKTKQEISFKDSLGSVHFFAAELSSYAKDRIDDAYFIPYIVNEIQRLMAHEGVNPKQCAILVKDRVQALRVTRGLKKAGIPFHNQRSSKLVDTIAFAEIRSLLDALIYPRQIAKVKLVLGGQIMGWTAAKIKALEELPLLEKILIQFYRWRATLLNEGVALAFNQILHTVLPGDERSLVEKMLEREEGLRLYQELMQIVEFLACEQSKHNILADGLVSFMNRVEDEEAEEESTLTVRQDPDADAVIITTIHSSKGLEYDIVFALGSAQRPTKLAGFILHHDGDKVVQTAFEKEDPQLQKVAEENSAESMRQLYVTLTRAKYRLYVPTPFISRKKSEFHTRSPIEQFLETVGGIDTVVKLQEYVRAASVDQSITCSVVSENPTIHKTEMSTEVPLLLPPPQATIPGEVMNMYSYSALTKGTAKSHAPIEQSGLPSSGDVGNFLHNILEDVPFALSKDELQEFLKPRVEGSLYKEWSDEVYQLIYDALNTELPLKTGKAPLSKMNQDQSFRETEFLFPWDHALNLPDVTPLPGYLKGVIDLVFEHDGFYYILDWKSNVLPGYDQEHLHQAMVDNHYLLQAEVYREAWRRFISSTDPRPFEELFGGVFYLFLRGLKLGGGVYYVK